MCVCVQCVPVVQENRCSHFLLPSSTIINVKLLMPLLVGIVSAVFIGRFMLIFTHIGIFQLEHPLNYFTKKNTLRVPGSPSGVNALDL